MFVSAAMTVFERAVNKISAFPQRIRRPELPDLESLRNSCAPGRVVYIW